MAVVAVGVVGVGVRSGRRRRTRGNAVDGRAPAQARRVAGRVRRPGRAGARRRRPRARRGDGRQRVGIRRARAAGRRSGPGSSSAATATSITNEHVVRNVADLRVRLYDGRELPGCVAGADPPTDIALVKIDSKGPLPVLPLGRFERRSRRRAGDRDRQPVRLQPQRHVRDHLGQGAGRRPLDAARAAAAGHLFVLHPDRRVDQPRQLGGAADRRRRRGDRRQRGVLGRAPAAAGAGHRLRDPDQHGEGAAAAAGARRQRAARVPGRRRAADRSGAGSGAAS